MRRPPLFFAVFLGIVFSVSALLHGYGWLRLVHDAAWPAAVATPLSVFFALAAISLPFSLFLARTRPVPAVSWAAFVWLGTIFYLDVSYLALDGLRALSSVALASTGAGLAAGSGRTFALVGAAIGLVLVGGGLLRGRSPIVRRVSVPIAGLPAAFEGFRIVQL